MSFGNYMSVVSLSAVKSGGRDRPFSSAAHLGKMRQQGGGEGFQKVVGVAFAEQNPHFSRQPSNPVFRHAMSGPGEVHSCSVKQAEITAANGRGQEAHFTDRIRR